ncbi:Na+ dependent nucleoside transporter C-terminus [Drosophila suzukii associated hytrosavirus 1]|nr:Na+ dependent nucleoside transporter C-terminus [Drosophila suzukii associated hytrosavirus 1]
MQILKKTSTFWGIKDFRIINLVLVFQAMDNRIPRMVEIIVDETEVLTAEPQAPRSSTSVLIITGVGVFFTMATMYTIYVLTCSMMPEDERTIVAFLYGILVLYMATRLQLYKRILFPYIEIVLDIFQETIYRDILTGIIFTCLVGFKIYLCFEYPRRIYAVCFRLVLLGIGVALNWRRADQIPWNVVLRALNLHFLLSIVLVYIPFGSYCMTGVGRVLMQFLKFSEVGSSFVYGHMLTDHFIFAFYTLSAIYLSYVTVALLRYIGFLDFIVSYSQRLTFWIGITPAEGVFGLVNIFVSMTETCLLVRHSLEKFSRSELFSLMVTGLSTISFTALFGYVSLGAKAEYLITSCIVSIPCGFAFAKIFSVSYDDNPPNPIGLNEISQIIRSEGEENTKNVLDKCVEAIVEANFAIQIIVGNIIASLSLMAFTDRLVEILIHPFFENMGLLKILITGITYIIPMLGVELEDSRILAEMFVKKMLVNEYLAFDILGKSVLKSNRSEAIANFMLCGFGNIASAGMLSSIIGSVTNFKVNTSSMLLRAVCVASMVNIYCACTVSLLVED